MKALSYLNKYLWKYKWMLLLGLLIIFVSVFMQAMLPQMVRYGIDEFGEFIKAYPDQLDKEAYYSETILPFAVNLILIYLAIALGRGITLFLTRQTIIIVSRKIEFDLKEEIFDQYQRLSLAFYKRNNTGDLMNRISEDVSKVRMYLGPGIMYTMTLFCTFCVVFTLMLLTDVELTLWTLLPLPIMAVLIYLVSSHINKRSEQVQRQQSKLTTFVQEVFSGVRVIKAYNRQDSAYDQMEEESNVYRSKSLRLVMINALFMPVVMFLIGLSVIITVYLGGVKTIEGGVSYGDITMFVMYVNILTWPFASLGWVTSVIQRAAASQERINEFLKEEAEIISGDVRADNLRGEIEFKNVSFTYDNSGKTALNGVNLKISQGQTLAIIGKTGSGKSTIADLVTRLYDATDGEILIDGRNIKEYDLESLRNQMGYVPQEVFLFSDSIKNNIQFGSVEDLPEETIIQSATDAHIHHNIIDFKDGYETVLGERGITLSGGQKQRISIARAIIRKPQILIFDDCLSAVDTETEEVILSNLKRIMADKSTIIISHRISSIQHADHIIYMEDGEILEQGTHQDLLERSGLYSQLFEKQLAEA